MQQRAVHPLSLARDFALQQGHQDAQCAVQTSTQIGHRQARANGPVLGLTGHAHQAAHALDDLVKPRAPGIGPVLPKARDAGQDDAGVHFGERLVVKAQFIFDIGTPVFYHHIGLGHQAHEHLHGTRFFEVQRHRALVAVDVLKVAALAVGGKHGLVGVDPRRRLHTNHVCAKVGEDAHAVGTCAHTREIDHFEARQGAGGLNFRHVQWVQKRGGTCSAKSSKRCSAKGRASTCTQIERARVSRAIGKFNDGKPR